MKEILAKNILLHRGFNTPHIMIFWKENDQICESIRENLEKIELKQLEETLANIIIVKWEDFTNNYEYSNNINVYTIFYMCVGLNIGTIESTDTDILNKFCFQCYQVAKRICTKSIITQHAHSGEHYIPQSFRQPSLNKFDYFLNDSIIKYKIKILSKYGSVPQFDKKINKSVIESLIKRNRNNTFINKKRKELMKAIKIKRNRFNSTHKIMSNLSLLSKQNSTSFSENLSLKSQNNISFKNSINKKSPEYVLKKPTAVNYIDLTNKPPRLSYAYSTNSVCLKYSPSKNQQNTTSQSQNNFPNMSESKQYNTANFSNFHDKSKNLNNFNPSIQYSNQIRQNISQQNLNSLFDISSKNHQPANETYFENTVSSEKQVSYSQLFFEEYKQHFIDESHGNLPVVSHLDENLLQYQNENYTSNDLQRESKTMTSSFLKLPTSQRASSPLTWSIENNFKTKPSSLNFIPANTYKRESILIPSTNPQELLRNHNFSELNNPYNSFLTASKIIPDYFPNQTQSDT